MERQAYGEGKVEERKRAEEEQAVSARVCRSAGVLAFVPQVEAEALSR